MDRAADAPTGRPCRLPRPRRNARRRHRRRGAPRRKTGRTTRCPCHQRLADGRGIGRVESSGPLDWIAGSMDDDLVPLERRIDRCGLTGPDALRAEPVDPREDDAPVGQHRRMPRLVGEPEVVGRPNGAMPSALIRRRTLRYVAVSESYVQVKVTSRPSGAIAPRWSQFRIRPVGSSRTVTGSDQVAPPSAERRWTTRWNHFDVSRNGLFDSMLRTRRPVGQAKDRVGQRRRTDVIRHRHDRHGVHVRPASWIWPGGPSSADSPRSRD